MSIDQKCGTRSEYPKRGDATALRGPPHRHAGMGVRALGEGQRHGPQCSHPSAVAVAHLRQAQRAGLQAPPVDAGAGGALPAVEGERVPGERHAAPLGGHAAAGVAERVAGGGAPEAEIDAARWSPRRRAAARSGAHARRRGAPPGARRRCPGAATATGSPRTPRLRARAAPLPSAAVGRPPSAIRKRGIVAAPTRPRRSCRSAAAWSSSSRRVTKSVMASPSRVP